MAIEVLDINLDVLQEEKKALADLKKEVLSDISSRDRGKDKGKKVDIPPTLSQKYNKVVHDGKENFIVTDKSRRMGLVDRSGKLVIPLLSGVISIERVQDKKTKEYQDLYRVTNASKKITLYDLQGYPVFLDDRSKKLLNQSENKEDIKEKLKAEFYDAIDLQDDGSFFLTKKMSSDHKLMALVDAKGNEIIGFANNYTSIKKDAKGNYQVVNSGGDGLVNAKGELMIKVGDYFPTLDENGNYEVERYGVGSRSYYQVYTDQGKELFPEEMTFLALDGSKNYIVANKKRAYGVYDKIGKVLIPQEYNEIKYHTKGYLAKKGNQWGALSHDGQMLVDMAYDKSKDAIEKVN